MQNRITYPYFSYGSNNLQQLADRVNRHTPFQYEPGFLKNHTRIFAGHSKRWEDGGVASYYPCRGTDMEGMIVYMTEEELMKLDTFEKGYVRIRKRVYPFATPDSYIYAYIYLKQNQIFSNMPSNSYLQAIHNNIKVDVIPVYGLDKETQRLRLQATWTKDRGFVY